MLSPHVAGQRPLELRDRLPVCEVASLDHLVDSLENEPLHGSIRGAQVYERDAEALERRGPIWASAHMNGFIAIRATGTTLKRNVAKPPSSSTSGARTCHTDGEAVKRADPSPAPGTTRVSARIQVIRCCCFTSTRAQADARAHQPGVSYRRVVWTPCTACRAFRPRKRRARRPRKGRAGLGSGAG